MTRISQVRVLVVEDNPDLLEVLKDDLSGDDLKVFNVANGYEALELLKKEKVDVVITDLKMPKIDGIGLRALAKDQGLDQAKLWIVYTGHSDLSLEEFKNAGFDEVLYKPLLQSTIKRVILQKMASLNK